MSVSKSRFLSVFILVMTIVVSGTYDLTGQITFSHRFFYDNATVASNVIELPESYLVSGLATDFSSGTLRYRQFFRQIDFEGNLSDFQIVGNDSLEFANFENVNTGTLENQLVLGTTGYLNGVRHGTLFWLNTEGDVMLRKDYLSPYFDADIDASHWIQPTDICANADGDIFVSAQIFTSETANDFCVFKLDPVGQLVWTYIHAVSSDLDVCLSMLATSLGGVWLAITEEVLEENTAASKLVELNANGELINSQEMPFYTTMNDFILVDESIVVATFRKESTWHLTGHVYKAGLNGDLEWETNLGGDASIEQQMYHIVESPDGSYVVGGHHFESIPENDELEGYYNWHGWLVKLSDDGDVIWDRRFHPVISKSDDHKMYDLKATSDGGYIFCGQATDNDTSNPDIELPSQQAWVVKVDQYGCLVPGCHVGVEEFAKREGLFKIGPNPVSQGDLLNIYVTDIQSLSQASIEVHDMQGKLVTSIQDLASSVTYILPIDDIPVGTYVVSLLDRGLVVDSEKLVVR